MKRVAQQVLVILLLISVWSVPVLALEAERSHGQDVRMAVGMGLDVSYGNYGSSADATLVTLPVVADIYPTSSTDIELNIPVVFLTSKSGSGVVVTSSGGTGRRRGATGSGVTIATTTVSTTTTEAGLGDINLTAGWTVVDETDAGVPKVRPLVYLKAPSGDRDRGLGTGTFEGGPGVALSKWFGAVQLFAESAYIFQDSNASYAGRNYVSYLAGAGLQTTERLFVSLQAKGSSSRSDGASSQAEGRVKAVFQQSRKVSWELYGSAGFTKASPDAGGGLLVMYQF